MRSVRRTRCAGLDGLVECGEAQSLDAPLVSEHIAFVRSGKLDAGHLLPVPRTREALDVLVENVRVAQRQLPVPLALENVACLFEWPEPELLALHFGVMAGLLPLGSPDGFPEVYFVGTVGFIGGFSERWAQDMLMANADSINRRGEGSPAAEEAEKPAGAIDVR